MDAQDYAWCKLQLKQTLQLLASPVETQMEIVSPRACVACEVCAEYPHYLEIFLRTEGQEITQPGVIILNSVREHLEQLDYECFERDALNQSPQWRRLRNLAMEALNAMGWDYDIPPKANEA